MQMQRIPQLLADFIVRRGQRPLKYGLTHGRYQDTMLRKALERRRLIELRSRDGYVNQNTGIIANLDGAQSGNEDVFVKPSATTVKHLRFGRAKAVDHILATPENDRVADNNLAIWQRRERCGCIIYGSARCPAYALSGARGDCARFGAAHGRGACHRSLRWLVPAASGPHGMPALRPK